MLRPRESVTDWLRRYGDPVRVKTITGNTLVTADTALVKELLATAPDNFVQFAPHVLEPVLGPESVLLVSGAPHKRDRKLLMPPFHGSRMRSYAEIMRDAARRHLRDVAGGDAVPAIEVTQRISLEVIIRAVFGMDDPRDVDRCADAMVAAMGTVGALPLFVPGLQKVLRGLGPLARYHRRRKVVDEILLDQLERTKANPSGDDILTMMVQARYDDGSTMSDSHILSELMTLLLAGHETTAISLAWAIDALHRHPAILTKARDEIDALGPDASAEALAKLPYLQLVVKEVLRMYPVVPQFFRAARDATSVGGHALAPGDALAVSVTCIHRSPELYPNPNAFIPERFERRKYGPHEYMPFGGGHRRCIGAAFAEFELRIVLAAALAEFDFELLAPSAPREVRRNITMAPRRGVPIRVRPRPAMPQRGRQSAA